MPELELADSKEDEETDALTPKTNATNETGIDKSSNDASGQSMPIKEGHVIYDDPDSPVTPLVVKTAVTLYEMSPFDVAGGTVDVTFDLWLVYDTEIYAHLFGNHCEVLPWTMPNAMSLDVLNNTSYKMLSNDLDTIQIFAKRQKFDNPDALKSFTIEKYTCFATLKLITFPSQDPFQSVYMVMKLAMDGIPGSEMTQYTPSSDCYFPGIRKVVGDFTKGKDAMREFRITCSYGEYSRLYMIFEYKKSPLKDIAKYYILPMLVNLLTIGFYDTVDSLFDSAGTYFLAIVALLFTLPDTGAFTRNEKSVVLGATFMLVILLVMASSPNLVTEIILFSFVALVYISLLANDFYFARELNRKYRTVLFDGDLSKLDVV